MADYRLTQSGDEVQEILNNSTPQSELTAETERATGAENQLQQNINNVQSNLNSEADTREQADTALRQFIQQVQGSLINYYLKTETYSATEINAMLAAIKQFRYQVVDELPTPSSDTMGIIYLVPSAHAVSGNIKDEYITLTRDEGSGIIYYFEQIGETAIDLSNYYTKAQTNAEISAAINTAIANYYTKQEVDALIANFITRTVSDLTNYYLKSETYTQAEIQQLIAAIKQFRYQSVAELPTASAATMGIIYLVPSTNPQQQNVKDEFITISATDQGTTTYSWEQIGSTEIDLSGYYTSQQTDAAIASALASYSTTEQMSAAIVQALLSYYTKQQVDALIANFITKSVNDLTYYYLKSDTYTKAEVQQLIDAVKQFTYVSVAELPTASADTMNKIYLVPSTNPQTKNVKDEFITIAVTDQGTTTYSWEQIGSTEIDLSGYYTSQQTDAAINTALSAYSTTSQMNASIAAAIANFYTKQEVDSLIANFITPSTQNLVYYYLKSETFTKTEVNQLIDAVKQFQYQSVQTLPTASAQTMNVIYLVPGQSPTSQNVKDEYITIATTNEMQETVYAWEKIGTTEIDLSNYYTKSQTDAAITAAINTVLADYSTTTQMTAAIAAALASYYTKTEVDALIADFITKSVNDLTYYYLKSETFTKSEVNALIAAVQQFTYQSVAELPTASAETMNKIYLVPSTNPETKNVKDEFITIAVTDQGTTTYSWEQIGSTTIDLSGYYTSAQTDAAINTALSAYSTTTQMNAAIAAAVASYYTKTEIDNLIANFITKSVNDLTYYYLKTETYSATEVDAIIAAIKQFQYVSVSELPTASASTVGKIYLVPASDPQQQNIKDEYITLTTVEEGTTFYNWEKIGSTSIDLSNYYTKTQTDAAINTALASYVTSAQMATAIATALVSYYTKTEIDNLIANFITKSVDDLVNYYLKSDTYTKSEVQQLISAVKQFTYQSVQSLPTASADTMNIIYLVPSSDPQTQNVKDEYITIATTEQDVTTYSWEKIGSTDIDLSGYYTSQQTDAAISAALASYSTTSQMTTAINTAVSGKQNAITDGAIIGLGYGICSTAAAVAAKEATITSFLLMKNMPITIKFNSAISAANSTLNITNTGAKPLYLEGTALLPNVILGGMIATIIYDGTNYNIVNFGYAKNIANPNVVDMGLTSGTLWAKKNLDVTQADGFAISEFQYECSFFSWGNVVGHNPISTSAFSYDFGSNNSGPYASTPGALLEGDVPVNATYDIARNLLGDPWQLPSDDDFVELIAGCDYVQADGSTVIDAGTANKLVTVNGIVGIYLKSKTNGNLLFFPCSGIGNGTSWSNRTTIGYYWSGSLASDTTKGLDLSFSSGGVNPQLSNNRFYGFTGRAVQHVVQPSE